MEFLPISESGAIFKGVPYGNHKSHVEELSLPNSELTSSVGLSRLVELMPRLQKFYYSYSGPRAYSGRWNNYELFGSLTKGAGSTLEKLILKGYDIAHQPCNEGDLRCLAAFEKLFQLEPPYRLVMDDQFCEKHIQLSPNLLQFLPRSIRILTVDCFKRPEYLLKPDDITAEFQKLKNQKALPNFSQLRLKAMEPHNSSEFENPFSADKFLEVQWKRYREKWAMYHVMTWREINGPARAAKLRLCQTRLNLAEPKR